MPLTDQKIISQVEAQGRCVGELFLIQGLVYWSIDAGDFQATSTYQRFVSESAEIERELVSFLMRCAAPQYESAHEVDDQIAMFREWEELYEKLSEILDRYGRNDPFGDGEFYLIDDCYASPQHKIECSAREVCSGELVSDVQSALREYSRSWGVIFAFPAVEGRDVALSVYASSCVERDGPQEIPSK